MRLRQKLLSMSVALVLAAVSAVVATALYVFSRAFEESLTARVEETLAVAANYVEDYRLRIRAAGELVAASDDFREALVRRRHAAVAPFVDHVRRSIYLADLDVYDAEGTRLFGSTDESTGEAALLDRELVRAGLALRKVERVARLGDELVVKSVHPVVSPEFEPLGAVLVSYPLNGEFLDLLKIVTNTHLVLLDPAGRPLASTFADASGRRVVEGIEPIARAALAGLSPNAAPRQVEGTVAGLPYHLGFDRLFGEHRRVAGFLGAAVAKGWFIDARSRVISLLATLTGLTLLAAVTLSLSLSNSITRPLSRLASWASGVQAGHIPDPIAIASADEVGELAASFNAMVERIRSALKDLEAANAELDGKLREIRILFDVSQTINYIPDTQELLLKILDKTIDATGADHASIMLLDDETGALALKMVRGIDYDRRAKVTIQKGIGIAGLVVDRGEPILVRDTDEDARFVIFNEDRKVRSLLCVPLLQSGKPFGVLNVVIREARNEKASFDRTDLRLSISIANQIALVVDKAKLYQASITDGMTKLYLNTYFKARLREEMRRSLRYGKPLSLIMCDIDHFKRFNDENGHLVGDRVLITFAEAIRNAVRDKLDIPARYGGEEFAVICPETPLEGAVTVAERIRQTIEAERFIVEGETLRVTASFGVAEVDASFTSAEAFVKAADDALYRSKEAGRNRVTVHPRPPRAAAPGAAAGDAPAPAPDPTAA